MNKNIIPGSRVIFSDLAIKRFTEDPNRYVDSAVRYFHEFRDKVQIVDYIHSNKYYIKGSYFAWPMDFLLVIVFLILLI